MKLPNRHHIYRYVPDYKITVDGSVVSNRRLTKDEQIVVRLSSITGDDEDLLQKAMLVNLKKFAPDRAAELNEERFNKLAAERFLGVSGLEIEGVDTASLNKWEVFREEAPRELREEVLAAMRSTEMLSAGEQKNFWPESDGV